MWCIGRLTEEYRCRMYGLLDLYARSYLEREPVVCIDEKSKQLLKDMRTPLSLKPGVLAKHDYEYKRAGTSATSSWPSNPRANTESWK